jgi:predicted RNA polymerase sigma factor
MIRTLRAFFLGRLLREKLLLVVFALLGVLMWLSSYSKRFGAFWREQHTTTVNLTDQQRWLDNRKALEVAAQKAAGRLDASQTLDGTRLLAAVNAIAAEAGLRNTSSNGATDQSNGEVSIHTLPYKINRADWEALKKFYLALSARSPYIGIERFVLNADRANPAQLNLDLTVTSVEINR